MQRIARFVLGLTLALLVSQPALAERFQSFAGGYQVHYNAVPTGMLDPAVARAYNIPRSRGTGLLTVSLLNEGKPVRARISALAANMNEQMRVIDMREVREADAVYYIGTFRASQRERLRFQLQVSPAAASVGPFNVEFAQDFFAD
ncbi:MAG: DUF4426 domain-containing protein [Ectothiorhodospiraceae bacterium]|jgi:hypothetical protein